MAKNFSYFIDDEPNDLVKRYEGFLTGATSGYFDVEEMGSIVDYYLMRGKTSESLSALEFGKKLHPESNLLDLKRAKIYLSTGDAQKAHRILNTLVENTDLEVRFLKIEALIKLGREREAYEIALQIIDEEEEEKIAVCLDTAMFFMTDGSFDYAVDVLKKGEELDDKSIDILFEKAFCYEQLSNFQGAMKVYQKIISIDTYLSEAWFNLGQLYFNQEDYEKALEAYDYVLVINDTDSISLIQKGHALFQLKRYEEAMEAYSEYAAQTTEKWHVHTFMGECLERMENFPKALFYYKKALEEVPNNFDALVGAGICYLEMDEYAESLSYINSALELDDKSADVWVYFAEANIGLNKMDEALQAFLKSASLEPAQADALMGIAGIYMDKGDFVKAVKYYESAYSFDPDLELIELFMAVAYYYTDNMEKTEEFLRLAIQKNLDALQMFREFCPDAEVKS